MARPKRPYAFYRRTTQKNRKPIYYVKIRTSTGEYTLSTGETSKLAAEKWVQDFLKQKTEIERVEQEKKQNITLAEFSEGFWNHEGNFAESRRARLRTITNGYLDNCAGTTDCYIIPAWGKYRLRDITTGKIDKWILSLVKDPVPNLRGNHEGVIRLAPATINRILQIFRIILEQACAEGYLNENPAKFVKPVHNVQKNKKGVLNPEEIKALLNPDIWDDYRHYAINVLTLATGIRISEVRGLQVDQIHDDYVAIHTAWADRYGLKEPKWGSCRDIPITPKVHDVLQKVIDTTKPQSIVFYSSTDYNRPMAKSYIEKKLYKAFHAIGIDDVQRKERNLSFHSHRHTLNTILRLAGVHDAKIRMITGHKQEAMTDHYTHFQLNDFADVAQATSSLF